MEKILIPSNDVRNYMEKQGRKLTDFEQATLIYNHSGMSLPEKTVLLTTLKELTADSCLREEIQDRLSFDEHCFSRFYENDGAYIYELEVYDLEAQLSYEQGYFTSGSIAVACGKKFKENFSVRKIILVTEEKDPEECHSDYSAVIYFDSQGQICSYYSSEVEWPAKKSEMERKRFEDAFVKILHPFKNGDFVRVLNDVRLKNEVCIIECQSADIDEQLREKQEAYFDYEDASLRVTYIDDNARFGHGHAKIVDLEFAELDEANPKYELLCCSQSLISGCGGLNDLQILCDEYRSRMGK